MKEVYDILYISKISVLWMRRDAHCIPLKLKHSTLRLHLQKLECWGKGSWSIRSQISK